MKKGLLVIAALTILLAVVLSPFASSLPDGLEHVAQKLNFLHRESSIISSPIPDYAVAGFGERVATSLAGFIGVVVVMGVSLLLGITFTRRK